MKFIFIFISIFCALNVSAQTDSTEIKLQQYKDMFVKGLISEKEYDKLKARLLHLGREKKADKQTLPPYQASSPVQIKPAIKAVDTCLYKGTCTKSSSLRNWPDGVAAEVYKCQPNEEICVIDEDCPDCTVLFYKVRVAGHTGYLRKSVIKKAN